MNLFDILRTRGFDLDDRTRMLRHQDKRYDMEMLFRKGMIEAYQSVQGRDCLNCDYVIAFIGRDRSKACFAGIWKVIGRLDGPAPKYIEGFPYSDYFTRPDDVYYKLEPVPGYEDLIGRMIIEWGGSTRAWNQWLKDKPITELLPIGQVKPFPGYLDFVQSFEEMKNMVTHSDANRVWHQMLGNVAGVYLITDNSTGELYVGSAYGKDGILGRWKSYALSGHGGNLELKRRLELNPNWKDDLSFTVLRTLPTTLTKREVILKEQLYKLKLGSKAHGLNLN